jgi:hypothetical protein
MKIFIICCLLFIHVNMCIFIRGFWVSIRVSGIRSGFGYPRVLFWWWISTRIGVRFGFGFRLRVSVLGARRLHPIRTPLVAILRLSALMMLYFHPLHPGHQDSLIYTYFYRTHPFSIHCGVHLSLYLNISMWDLVLKYLLKRIQWYNRNLI